MIETLEQEARIFTRYLIGRNVSDQALQLYVSAMTKSKLTKSDEKLLKFMRTHPLSIGFIDAGLVFHNPDSEVRRRLYVMLAILESSTENVGSFLPEKRSLVYVLSIVLSCTRAVIRAGLGLVLVKVVV